MSLLGFGNDPEVEDQESDDMSEKESVEVGVAHPETGAPQPLKITSQMQAEIFAKVVEVFNASLPSFLAESVNPEAQKRLLYQSLDASIQEYLQSLDTRAQAICEARWEQERNKMLEESAHLKRRMQELEEKRTDMQDRQLSIDRQKRALTERVRDLENQVLNLEAEKEQYELETKCMVNKAKAAAVLESEIEALREENQRLSNQTNGTADNSADLNQLAAQQIEKLQAEVERLNSENQQLQKSLDETKEKDKLNDAMFSDFQSQASQSAEEAGKLKLSLEQLQQDMNLKDARMADLQKELAQREAIVESLNAKLAEMNEQKESEDSQMQQEIEEIRSQVELFEGVKSKMDARIEKLKNNLQTLQKENESLRETIKSNLMDHAQEEKKLKDKIRDLEVKIESESAIPAQSDETSAMVDELLSGTDWLVSVPAKDSSMRSPEDSSDFGYLPPQRKSKQVNNDAQLSLFD